MLSTRTSRWITGSVRSKYEAFPYPSLKMWEGISAGDYYHHSSSFAAKLFESRFPDSSHANWHPISDSTSFNNILIAGCGEALPVALGALEPRNHRLIGVDISRSSIQRARYRLMRTLNSVEFAHAEIGEFLADTRHKFTHIDSSHVLEFTSNPREILSLMSQMLVKNGTIKLVVHNKNSRRWIRQIRKAFQTLGLNSRVRGDLVLAQKLLEIATEYSSVLGSRISTIKSGKKLTTLELSENFFHPYENFFGIRKWLEWVDAAGLQVYSMLDRRLELLDLRNPLWQVPTAEEIEKRVDLGFMTGSFDLYLCHKNLKIGQRDVIQPGQSQMFRLRRAWNLPNFWSQNDVLSQTSNTKIYPVWLHMLMNLHKKTHKKSLFIEKVLSRLDEEQMSLLSRLGAITPEMLDQVATEAAYLPVIPNQKATRAHNVVDFFDTQLAYKVEKILRQKRAYSSRRFYVVMERFVQSQF